MNDVTKKVDDFSEAFVQAKGAEMIEPFDFENEKDILASLRKALAEGLLASILIEGKSIEEMTFLVKELEHFTLELRHHHLSPLFDAVTREVVEKVLKDVGTFSRAP